MVIDYNSVKDLINYIRILKLSDLIIFSCFEIKEIKSSLYLWK
jgi:hypothetical protein